MRSTKEIKNDIDNLQVDSSGARTFHVEIRKEILKSLKSFMTTSDASRYYGIDQNTISRWIKQQEGPLTVRSVKHGRYGRRYALSTKIEVAKRVLEENESIKEVSIALGMDKATISTWIRDYQDGVFDLKNTTQVSRKKFTTSDVYIKKIQKEESEIEHYEKEIAKKKLSIEENKKEAKEAIEREYKEKLSSIAS